jgi:armadillo repeat-containing protein 7
MFSTSASLRRRTGRFGVGRAEYLKQLLNEYEHASTNDEHKLQILANFANFSYDPINYPHIRDLNLIDLFLDCLRQHHENNFAHYALSGLCNLSSDPLNGRLIVEKCPSIVVPLVRCLLCSRFDMVMNSMITLMFLVDHHSHLRQILKERPELRQTLTKYSESKDKRLANMATVFLQDYL